MLLLPMESNPVTDLSGKNCPAGETATIFFLAGSGTGTPVTRSCTVPTTKRLFFPIINVECSDVEARPFFGATDAAHAACADAFMDDVGKKTLQAILDGVAVPRLGDFRAASPPFDFTMPAQNNFLGIPGVTSGRSASDGFWLLLQPPSTGSHTIHFEAAVVSGLAAGFTINVT